MSGYVNPDQPGQRLSDAERDAAVGRLAAAQAEGRLTIVEFEERERAARAAVTRADLVPLFADLPETATAQEQLPFSTAATAQSPSYAPVPPPASPYVDAGAGSPAAGSRALGGRSGATIMALAPFIALGLFFLFGFIGSFAWSWLWFLLIPIAGIVIYGPGSEDRRAGR
ncbi:MAG: DUF1707 domain-containing protein [Actinomycetota bacterium]|nr:DUF1707 domain-containing protein [Actinomycetota bacterium]MDQ2698608.1 DUF1707 domain-containing protein [Actinomycetota bacterium]